MKDRTGHAATELRIAIKSIVRCSDAEVWLIEQYLRANYRDGASYNEDFATAVAIVYSTIKATR